MSDLLSISVKLVASALGPLAYVDHAGAASDSTRWSALDVCSRHDGWSQAAYTAASDSPGGVY